MDNNSAHVMQVDIVSSSNRDITIAALYRPSMEYFLPSIIGCFVVSDDWNEKALSELQETVGADFLVGIQTKEHSSKHLFEHMDIVKTTIKCQPDQVDNIIQLLDIYSSRYVICLNLYDIKSLFECSKSFKFIQTGTMDNSEPCSIQAATQELVSQIPSVDLIKGIFVNPESNESLALDDYAYISNVVESACDSSDIYYSQSTVDAPSHYCLRAIYAEP